MRLKSVLLFIALVLVAFGPGLPADTVAGMPIDDPGSPVSTTSPSIYEVLGDLAAADPAAKIDAALRGMVSKDVGDRDVWVVVQSVAALDLSAFSDRVHQFTWPAGEHVSVLKIPFGAVGDIAALPSVYSVDSGELAADGSGWLQPDSTGANAIRANADELRARARAAAPWRSDAADAVGGPGGTTPDGWWDVGQGHAARDAWEMGYDGDGVTVAVIDYPIDYAHPDLQGTWATLPAEHPYGGWPQVFDPQVGLLAVQDQELPEDERSTRMAANGMIELYQTSEVTERDVEGQMVPTACFSALLYITQSQSHVLDSQMCDFVVPDTSMGGTVRYGHHPDTFLRAMGAKPDEGIEGEWAGVLLVDEAVAGIYDTVYVDIDGDRDFTDEKPMKRGSPVGWRDINDDGLADLSAGILYFIADGELPFPGSWLWGLEEEIPTDGEFIGIQYVNGDHGTMCAAGVASQGVVGVPDDRLIQFGDLPGDMKPESLDLGMSPGAGVVSIGSVYSGGDAAFDAGWRYAIFGLDPDRDDDDVQVASNSYGFSGTDDDGWDPDSRLIDHYVRAYAPNLSLLFSTGNGGPGFGTMAPPSPSVSMGIGASAQRGSDGSAEITGTYQITFGDISPFSDRGPGADGSNGPAVSANGDDGTGAYPINFIGDGAHSVMTWGGTSRSAPVASGAMALVYQAFDDANGRWPTWQEARSILMSGARFSGYDVFTTGAGVVDAGDAVRIAAGEHGIYALPAAWTAGGYRGTTYPAFANLVAPGGSETTTITLSNPSEKPVDVQLSGQVLRRTATVDDGVLVTDRTQESTASRVPDYLRPIDLDSVPEGTDLMIARGIYPMSEFDPDGNLDSENFYYVSVVQHTDVNGDGELWTDDNENGVVNHASATDPYVEVLWDDQREELACIEGAITVQLATLEGQSISGEYGWFGLACNAPPQPPGIYMPVALRSAVLAADDASPRAGGLTGKIALIERGDCPFVEKLTNAENAGAIAAVVFTDDRDPVAMGGDGSSNVPGVMIDRQSGLDIVERLDAGTVVSGGLYKRLFSKGVNGSALIDYGNTEVQEFEYNDLAVAAAERNHFAVAVHHPRERWADGLYLGLRHVVRSPTITNTNISLRYDFYAYQDWDALALSEESVTIPAGGETTVEVTLSVPEDAAPGAYQGAVFADYARPARPAIYMPVALKAGVLVAGDTEPAPGGMVPNAEGSSGDVHAPGGYELPGLRTVIPVNYNVAPAYDWEGTVTLGGADASDPDVLYNNGEVWGTFRWDWRAESGEWRFFFVDAVEPPDNTYWLFRTTWEDDNIGYADIDTRVYGPMLDRFTDPDHPENVEESWADDAWYGPYGLARKALSPYLSGLNGSRTASTWPFNTSSGANEDWLALEASEGLHEVMLHNVLFSGDEFTMPFETAVSSIQVPASVDLVGEECGALEITPQMELSGLEISGYGLSDPPASFTDHPVVQDDPDDPASAGFKYPITATGTVGLFEVVLDGEPDDDLDLFVMYDANGDGQFEHPDELVASSTTPTGDEVVTNTGLWPPGNYEIWVLGWQVTGESTFDIFIDVTYGDALVLGDIPDTLAAGETASIEVCVDTTTVDGMDGPFRGTLQVGLLSAPDLFRVPVNWQR